MRLKEQMRICLISREFPPDTGWGGIGTFVHDLALGLNDIGEEVEVISLSATGAESTTDYKGIPIHRVPLDDSFDSYQMLLSVMPYSHSIIKAIFALHSKFLELHSKKPFDVVEVPEMFGEGVFNALSKETPLVVRLYTPHFKFIDDQLHLVDDAFDHQFIGLIEKITMLTADIVTSPSSDLGDYVSKAIGFEPGELPVMRGLIDTNRFCPDGKKALEKADELKIVFVGRLEERKGVYQLVNAVPKVVAKFPKAKFYLIGKDTNTAESKSSVKDKLLKTIDKDGTQDNIVFTGPVPHSDMPEYFRSSDIFVLPSLYDNAPLTCLEAISSGVPVVGSAAGGMKEYVVHDESGLIIPPGDVDALADALIELLESEKKRKSFGQAARKRSLELFDRKITARKSVELYEIAKTNYSNRQKYALYRKDREELLSKSKHILAAFDDMIYDMMYNKSLAFRLSYWYHMQKDNPRAFALKSTAGLGEMFKNTFMFKKTDANRAQKVLKRVATQSKMQSKK